MRALVRSLLPTIGVMLCVSAVADTRYRVVDLGAFPSGQFEYFPFRITDQTQILGYALNISGTGPYSKAFLWQPKTGYIDLPPLTNIGQPIATGIGPTGTIVGYMFGDAQFPNGQACTWDTAHVPHPLGPNPTFESTAADIAAAVMFFAAAPQFITGQVLAVDGGLGL